MKSTESVRFSTLHHGVRARLGISWAEYVLLDTVYHLSAKYGFCYMSQGRLAEVLGISRQGTIDMINRLVKSNLLVKDPRGLVCGSDYIDIAYLTEDDISIKSQQSSHPPNPTPVKLDKQKKSDKTTQKSTNFTPPVKKVDTACKETLHNNNKYINNIYTDSSTNVLQAPEGQEKTASVDINLAFIKWEELVGYPISSKNKANRYACSNLLKKHGPDKVNQLIAGVALAQADQYAPRIADFCALQSKLSELIAWGNRRNKAKGNGAGKVYKI